MAYKIFGDSAMVVYSSIASVSFIAFRDLRIIKAKNKSISKSKISFNIS